jgi:hypothetical protein
MLEIYFNFFNISTVVKKTDTIRTQNDLKQGPFSSLLSFALTSRKVKLNREGVEMLEGISGISLPIMFVV